MSVDYKHGSTWMVNGIFHKALSAPMFTELIGVRDELRFFLFIFWGGGGAGRGAEVSCPNIFPLLGRKSSGFARILLDFFLPENGYLKILAGCSPPCPMARTPVKEIYVNISSAFIRTVVSAIFA